MDVATVRELFCEAHREALRAVGGRDCVRRYLRDHPAVRPTHVAAVGKAAAPMVAGALDVLGDRVREALVITKSGHLEGLDAHRQRARCIESAHPLPDERSLEAGRALSAMINDAPRDASFLIMISGGASALVERLSPGLDADFLARVNDWLLSSGLPIGDINRVRKRISQIKAGRLAALLRERDALCLMISDVPGDDPGVIGSGLLIPHSAADIDVSDLQLPGWLSDVAAAPPPLAPESSFDSVRAELVARPSVARRAAAQHLEDAGLKVNSMASVLEGDALEAGRIVVRTASGAAGTAHVWNSETTVVLPPKPGRGGRCQTLALSAARVLDGLAGGGVVLAAGTDGTDGPGDDAGAVVDGATVARGRRAGLEPLDALESADAGRFLAASGDLLRTGPTGTNVMDLVMAWCADRESGSPREPS